MHNENRADKIWKEYIHAGFYIENTYAPKVAMELLKENIKVSFENL